LSKEELLFSAEGGTDSVTAKDRFWLSGDIGIGDTIVNCHSPSTYFLRSEAAIMNIPPSYDYEGDISCLSGEDTWYEEGIKGPWFAVYRLDDKKIFFSVNKNETGKKRNFRIFLDAGDCGAKIEVTQSAE
jgi:hypothetical protein